MDHVFLARQPILDRTRAVRGYELLYRTSFMPRASVDDGETATARVALNALTEIGLDRVVGDQAAWINVTTEFLLQGLALSLPAPRIVLELLEHSVDRRLLELLGQLRGLGYELALTHVGPTDEIEPLLALAGIVKLDYAMLGAEGLVSEAERLSPYGLTLVAEKIETPEEFEVAAAAGCQLFQGYFFCRPELIRDRAITPNAVAMLRLASALQDPALELGEIERLISSDVALSYRLLRYINSAYFGVRQQVASIMHAVTLLGLENVRQWATLTTFTSVADKPPELFLTALIRARFCQLAGEAIDGPPEERFTLGLFSVVDALTDTTMETAVALLPLPQRTRDALVTRSGPGRLLECVEAIEQGQFGRVARRLDHPARDYASALAWANETAKGLEPNGDDDDPFDDEYQ